MRAVKAILFDLDNTLIDRNLAVEKYMRQWLITNFPQTEEQLFEVEIQKIMQKDNWGYISREIFFEWLKESYKGIFLVEDSIEHYLMNVPLHVTPSQESNALLLELRNDFDLGILTNGSGNTQRMKLETSELKNLFSEDRIFVSGELGIHKPDPEVFLKVLDSLDLFPDNVLMVGDDPLNDIHGAKSVGIKTCWISHDRLFPAEYQKPDYTVNTISGILNLVSQW